MISRVTLKRVLSVGNNHEVLSAVVMNVAMFRYVAPCSPYVNQHFGGTYHLHLQGLKIIRARTQRATSG
jgi:hypothetical protein